MSGAPVGEGGGGGSDGADLDRLAGLLGVWAADAAARDAAGSRARQRWLAEQAGAEATLVGALVDLAEAAATCELRTAAASFTGRIEAVGRDFCVVGPAGADVPAGRSPGRPAGGWSATAAGGWPATGEGSAAGERTVVALGAVVAVHPAGPPPPSPARHLVSGARPAPLELTLADVAGVMAADRMLVVLHLAGGVIVRGALQSAGDELLVLAPTGPDRRAHVVATRAVEALASAPS